MGRLDKKLKQAWEDDSRNGLTVNDIKQRLEGICNMVAESHHGNESAKAIPISIIENLLHDIREGTNDR